jgi:PKD repeat protein
MKGRSKPVALVSVGMGCIAVIAAACNSSGVNKNPNQPPVADAGGPITVGIGANAPFTGAASVDPDGTIVDYQWDFGDGAAIVSGQTADHAYASVGVYHVKLTVKDNDGATNTVQKDVTVAAGAYGGTYAVQSTPSSQLCAGLANVSFVSTNVIVTTTNGDTVMKSDWGLGLATNLGIAVISAPTGPLNGNAFVNNWVYTQTQADVGGFCGHPIVTTYTNAWTGTFNGDGTITSSLQQGISDDCGLLSCQLAWPDIHGVKTN